LSMIGTVAVIIAASTLAFAVITTLMGTFSLFTLGLLVVGFNIVQWLFAPRLIDAIYKVREVSKADSPKLYGTVEMVSKKSGLKMPRVMLANIPMPNAFAYGSPIYGTRVAVTKGALDVLEEEEVEAVVGHELGHLRHGDVQIMMFASVLPALFYFIGYSMMMSAWFGGGRNRQEGGAVPVLIGMTSMAIYWILSLLVLGLSRLREYYADQHAVAVVEDGPRKLSEALAKIVTVSANAKRQHAKTAMAGVSSFRTLFIDDPDRAESDATEIARTVRAATDQDLVRSLVSKRVSTLDRLLELLSSHPNMVKRLNALQRLG
jgi:heat shock protein HtpX